MSEKRILHIDAGQIVCYAVGMTKRYKINREYAKRLDAWMMLEGYTDRTLAEALGIDNTYVWYIRHGKKPVTDMFKWRFAERFGFELTNRLFNNQPLTIK